MTRWFLFYLKGEGYQPEAPKHCCQLRWNEKRHADGWRCNLYVGLVEAQIDDGNQQKHKQKHKIRKWSEMDWHGICYESNSLWFWCTNVILVSTLQSRYSPNFKMVLTLWQSPDFFSFLTPFDQNLLNYPLTSDTCVLHTLRHCKKSAVLTSACKLGKRSFIPNTALLENMTEEQVHQNDWNFDAVGQSADNNRQFTSGKSVPYWNRVIFLEKPTLSLV